MNVPQWISKFLRTPKAEQVQEIKNSAETAADTSQQAAKTRKTEGDACLAHGKLDAAAKCYHEAVALDASLATAHNGLGVVMAKRGDADGAAACFRTAAALDPTFADAHCNLGNTLLQCGRPADAILPLQAAVDVAPNHALAHYNLGTAFLEQDRLDEAFACFRRTAALDPDFSPACHNLRVVLHRQGRLAEVIGAYQQACAREPENAALHNLLGMALLSCGALENGWRHYEYRFRAGTRRRNFPQPELRGDNLGGKALLVWKEQGIGDEIMFAGIYPEIIMRAKRCVIECTPKLLSLFARSFPDARIVPGVDPPDPATLDAIDLQCAAGTLARWLRPTVDSFPKHKGYLVPDAARAAYWKARLTELGAGLKIGFCWRSSLRSGTRELHYTRLDQWGPIFAVPGVHFVSLQYDECTAELDDARRRFGVPLHTFPEIDLFDDIDETAALTHGLDLVISAPTAVSGLAPALGVPTWTMSYGTSWCALGTEHDPWFPAVRCFRLRWGHTWNDVIDALVQALDDSVRAVADGAAAPFAPPATNAAAAEDCLDRGEAHFTNGELNAAATLFRRAIELRPDHISAYRRLSHLLFQRGESDIAEMLLEGGIALNPKAPVLHNLLGELFSARGMADKAIACYKKANAIVLHYAGAADDTRQPARTEAEAFKNRGNAHLTAGEPAAAVACYCQAVATDPTYAEGHNNLGVVLLQQGHADHAMACFDQALKLKPGLAQAHLNRGNILRQRGLINEAVASFRASLSLDPALSEAHNSLGTMLQMQDDIEGAQASFETALRLNPGSSEAHHNLGHLLQEKGLVADAATCFQKAIDLKPGLAEAHFGLATALLSCGRLAEGWAKYKCRFAVKEENPTRRVFSIPEWSDEPLTDKSLLLWEDQGIGDEILFASMIPEIAARARNCVVECAPKLLPLFARSFPDATVVSRTNPPHPAILNDIDLQIATADAARWLRPSLESFPAHDGYLIADPTRTAYWKARLSELGPGLKVGFCWRSGLLRGRRHLHYTSLDQWGPIFAVPGVHFVNLQYDECDEELATARRRFGVPLHAFDEVDLYDDLDEAAALTKAMDLVITAPTAASGLAAAQGVPTWEMGYGTAWVSLGTNHVPWFPSQRLFLRRWDQPWDDVIGNIAKALEAHAGRAAAGT